MPVEFKLIVKFLQKYIFRILFDNEQAWLQMKRFIPESNALRVGMGSDLAAPAKADRIGSHG